MKKLKDTLDMFTKLFKKQEVEETSIKYSLQGDKLMLSCRCLPGDEKRFAELWLLATVDGAKQSILGTISTRVSKERYHLILEEVNKLENAAKALKEILQPRSGPVVRPRDVFRNMSNDGPR